MYICICTIFIYTYPTLILISFPPYYYMYKTPSHYTTMCIKPPSESMQQLMRYNQFQTDVYAEVCVLIFYMRIYVWMYVYIYLYIYLYIYNPPIYIYVCLFMCVSMCVLCHPLLSLFLPTILLPSTPRNSLPFTLITFYPLYFYPRHFYRLTTGRRLGRHRRQG
jgi:hypothetical protein